MIIPKDCYLKSGCRKYRTSGCPFINCDSDEECSWLFRANSLYKTCKIPESRIYDEILTASNKDVLAFETLNNWKLNVRNHVKKGDNLLIYSNYVGNGKSSWAWKITREYLNKISPTVDPQRCRVLFIDVPTLLIELKTDITTKNEDVAFIRDHIFTADLVIWDDIATKTTTDFEAENLFMFINGRLDKNKSNIYTSNISSPQALDEILKPRLSSRILGKSTKVKLEEGDKRAWGDT